MPKTDKGQELLEGAYDLETPEDNRRYYREFATGYDQEFADALGYVYPQALARSYQKLARSSDRPVADIGCGTGLVAQALQMPADQIYGIDISPEMLAIARSKSLYQKTYALDLTGPLNAHPDRYGAFLSAGTFTHGHLGPDSLVNLLNIARPSALFCIGVNQNHFEAKGFHSVLQQLVRDAKISAPVLEEIDIYDCAGHDHAKDKALILSFRAANPSNL